MFRAQWRTALMRPPSSYFRLAFASILVAAGMLLTVAEPVSAGLAPQTLDCTSSVSFGLVQATTAGCSLNQVSSTQYTSSATVTINGIPFPPVPGTNLTLNLPSAASPGGSISVDLQNPVSAAGINWVPAGSLFTWHLPAGGPGPNRPSSPQAL